MCVTTPAFNCPWPAEPSASAVNLTPVEGPLVNDFHKDLSGAVWNPVTSTLWVCRNTSSDSKTWAVVPDAAGGFAIDTRNGQRGEWSDFGDLEGLTLADFEEPDTLYLIIEGQGRIKEVDLSTYGTAHVMNDWDTSAYLAASGGITFVPDAFLVAQGFVDGTGPPTSAREAWVA